MFINIGEFILPNLTSDSIIGCASLSIDDAFDIDDILESVRNSCGRLSD